MRCLALFIVLVFVARIAPGAECASPLQDAHIAGIRTFLEGYSPGFSAGPGVPVAAAFASWTKKLSSAQAQALRKNEYTVVKEVILDSTKANHLRNYMLEAGDTNIPWWATPPASVIPSAWVVVVDALAAALHRSGASAHQSLTKAAGTVAAGGRVQALECVVNEGPDLLFVSLTVYQAKVANDYRTTVLQRCSGRVRIEN